MAIATFTEEIAARDLTIPDDADWTTPSTDDLPNGDTATQLAATDGYAAFDEPGTDFALPWGSSDWTLEIWLRYTSGTTPGSVRPILTRSIGTSWGFSDWLLVQSGDVTPVARLIVAQSGGSTWHSHDLPLTSGSWHHVVFTLNTSLGVAAVSGRQTKGYVDASLITSVNTPTTTLTPLTVTDPHLLLGSPDNLGLTIVEMGKLAIYHRALTGTEISDHYDAMTT